MSRVSFAVPLLLLVCGCSKAPPAPHRHASLGGTVVARVGESAIDVSLVRSVAVAQGLAPDRALDALIDDALLAQGARARGLDRLGRVRRDLDASDARSVIERLRAEALAKGPPTDAEVDELTAAHWRDVDVPESLRVVHAVAMRPKKKDDREGAARAQAVAAAIAAAVAPASSPEEFESRAKAVPHDDVDVRVERLGRFVADGRMVEGEGTFDPAFVAAAFALSAPGATSGVVETPFGWHVIRLVDRIPGAHVDREARRRLFTEEVVARRAHRAYDALLGRLHAEIPVSVEQDAETRIGELTRGSP